MVDLEVLDQDLDHAAGHRGLDLQQRRRAVAELLELLVHRLEQVVRAVFAKLHIGVADDAEEVRARDVDAREQLAEVHADDVFEKRKRVARRRRLLRNRDEARTAPPAP